MQILDAYNCIQSNLCITTQNYGLCWQVVIGQRFLYAMNVEKRTPKIVVVIRRFGCIWIEFSVTFCFKNWSFWCLKWNVKNSFLLSQQISLNLNLRMFNCPWRKMDHFLHPSNPHWKQKSCQTTKICFSFVLQYHMCFWQQQAVLGIAFIDSSKLS